MAKAKKYVLTEQERDFAEKNHNLIYTFLHRNHLEIDEFYEPAAFGFLRAVVKYHRLPWLKEKYEFYNIAWNCLRTNVGNEIDAKRRRTSHIAYSFDNFVNNDTPYGEFPADDRDGFWQLEQELEIQRFLALIAPALSKRQQVQIALKLLGCKRKDIAKRQGISVSTYKRDQEVIKKAAVDRLRGEMKFGRQRGNY